MKRFIVFPGGLFAMALATAVLFATQGAIHDCGKGDGAKVLVNVNCTVQKTVVYDNGHATLVLDCQGQKAVLRDPKTVASYLNNPNPLTCTVYESGKAKCQPRE